MILFELQAAPSQQDCSRNLVIEDTSTPDEMEEVYLCLWRREGILNKHGMIDSDIFKNVMKNLLLKYSKNSQTRSEVSDYIVEKCSKLDTKKEYFGTNLNNCIDASIATKLSV
ncbi:hypothetical protein FQR65_LT07642 [Abscondita terminalis]|nr:hypothetical protein FQR65_LT07642 [Abscondita terminalis]